MKRIIAFVLFLMTAIVWTSSAARAEDGIVQEVTIYAVTTTNQLQRFRSNTPGTLVTVGPISGLQFGENILGIDFRPATGQLYALGSTSRLYTINTATAAATFVATLSTALSGTDFGFDFNPVPDRIRIVSNTGQNLRVNHLNGMTLVDGMLNPGMPSVAAAAYTNSFSGATATTLYVIDTATSPDRLAIQNPPNSGTLSTVGTNLGFDTNNVNGFDISALNGIAYAVVTNMTGNPVLFTVNLTAGTATSVGAVGPAGNMAQIRGIAAEQGGSAQNLLLIGLTSNNELVRFNSQRPNILLGAPVAITGLQTGESVQGIDFRPATGQLFALGSTSRIYRVNPVTGAAVSVGILTTALNGNLFGFDFNPVPDRIRIVSDLDQNLRANPADGTNLVDGTLAYAAGDPNAGQNPAVTAAGYTNSFGGATSTTLYDIDTNLDILAIQNPPNSGTLNTIGPLGVNVIGNTGFDIAPGNNVALAAFQVFGQMASGLYQINLTTGAASFIGPIGSATPLRGLAIAAGGGSGSSRTLDFDGDGRTDYAVFRLSNNFWYINPSSINMFYGVPLGIGGSDVLTPGDYDGDGRTDIAVWRPTNGAFYVLRSTDNVVTSFLFGQNGDEPIARDYDGDGRTDYAVVRRTGGNMIWYIINSATSGFRAEQFGADTDITAPGDFDGDGRFDLGVRRGTGNAPATFFVGRSRDGFLAVQWGLGADLVVPGDYDGDGRTDFTALRTGTNYIWYILQSSTNSFNAPSFGTKPHLATQGDYDGDGKTDVSVWDPVTGRFFVLRTSNATSVTFQFGQNGDVPVANFDTH